MDAEGEEYYNFLLLECAMRKKPKLLTNRVTFMTILAFPAKCEAMS